MFSLFTLHIFFCEASFRQPLKMASFCFSSSLCVNGAGHHGLRYCASIPDGLKLINIDRKNLAPWVGKNQKKSADQNQIDISKFCADHERGILYRYQSAKELSENKENFPLFKKHIKPFDRFSDCKEMGDVFDSMGLVESFYQLGDLGGITTLGTGFLVRPDAILTAAHNLTIDPKDSPRVKKSMEPNQVKFHLRYDDGVSTNIHTVLNYKIPKEWSIGRDNAYDFSVLFLGRSIQETKIKLACVEKHMKLPIPIRVAGYPNEIPGSNVVSGLRVRNDPLCSYSHDGELTEMSDCRKIIGYTCLTEEGVSGGPVIVRDWPIALGLHTRGLWDLNRGVHHSDHMAVYLKKWFSECKKTDDIDSSVNNEITNIICELSKSDEEKEYLLSKTEKLKSYPIEDIRNHISLILDMHRAE